VENIHCKWVKKELYLIASETLTSGAFGEAVRKKGEGD
jgi:hypothetical protein